jgi:hypothetical protein
MDFIDFVTSLAPEGETVLFVQQKKGGYIPQLPSAPRRAGAWYVSSGSFILDRMTEGVRATTANCTHVTFIAVDDVGTKSKVPPLPPTWIIETSPGNYQWAWVLSEQVPVAVAGAAERAFAEAGYTDAGAINPVRNWRIPGSVNIKPGRNRFAAVLTEFHHEREFTLEQICAALGVTPAEADTATARRVALDDDGTDDVLAWLSEAGHLTAQGNAAGWWGVVELGRVERREWYKRFAYVQNEDSFFDLVDRREVSRAAFNALYRHIKCESIHSGRRVEASVCFDENRQTMGAAAVAGVTYAAGENVLVARGGDPLANRWRDARPAIVSGGDATPWLEHCRLLVPDEALLSHLWDVMAFKLQNPKVKINHAVLHGGDEGCGKDSMWAPFIWSVCGPHMANRGWWTTKASSRSSTTTWRARSCSSTSCASRTPRRAGRWRTSSSRSSPRRPRRCRSTASIRWSTVVSYWLFRMTPCRSRSPRRTADGFACGQPPPGCTRPPPPACGPGIGLVALPPAPAGSPAGM